MLENLGTELAKKGAILEKKGANFGNKKVRNLATKFPHK